MNRNHSLRTSAYFLFIGMVLLAIIGYYAVVPQSAATVATFAVNSTADATDAIPGDGICDDGAGNCTLRAAIVESDFSGGSNVINVPAGTYTLTGPADDEFNGAGATLDTGDLDIVDLSAFAFPSLISVTINGAGSGTTIIDGGGVDRVFDINNFAAVGASVDVTLSGLTIRNGNAPTSEGYNPSGGGIQFDGFNNGTFVPAGTLTITDCKITSNTAAGQGGGILAVFGSLNMTGSEVSGNTATNGAGGGISYDGSSFGGLRTLTINNGKISGNHANSGTFGNGGGIWEGGNATKSITRSAITGNSAGANGGGVFNGSGALTLNYNVIVGNTSTGVPPSSGLRNNTGAVNADNNWWGCNGGPTAAPCDRASGLVPAAWLQLHHTATPNSIGAGGSVTLQADFFTNNLNTGINAADLVALNGRAVTFNNAVHGTISGADATINAGKANATFTAANTAGSGSADATVDQETQTASITVLDAPPTITCAANITTEATCPAGAVVNYAEPTYTGSNVTLTRTAGPASGSTFPIGTTTVSYTATNSGGSASCSFTVTVLTPQATLQNLIASVNASSLTGTQKNGLLAKLNAALSAINNGQTNVACNKLSEFINSVQNLVNHGDITAAQSQAWINSANHIRNTIGCTNTGCS